MTYYCSTADVGSRLALDSSQRTRAGTRLTSAIRRATIDIDQEFLQYGRSTPSKSIGDTTLNGLLLAGATSVVLTSGTTFESAGNGNIDGDSFAWTGKSTHTLTGVTGVSFDHADDAPVQSGEMAHVLREICADISAAYYLEDEAVFQSGADFEKGGMRSNVLRQRGLDNLRRLAHLGSVD
tara:strand:- start:34145 stop:34687 length:543 start_codon:yes stop_codon:yes gene_type:complete